MTEPESGEEATLFPKTAGERLRDARAAQNLSLADVAARTRIPIRHLEAIEASDYTGLPSPTYAVGFAKAYARAVGADEVSIGRDVRGEVESRPRTPEYEPYDLADPSRLPPRGLATVLAVLAVLIVVALAIFFGTTWFRGSVGGSAPATEASAPAPAPSATPAAAPSPTPAAPANGQVELTATDVVWLRVYDANNTTLFMGEMKPGDRYDVPANADRPMINVGRPDKLTVTVNGSAVPPLGTGARPIKDVEVTAQALIARQQGAAAATQGGSGAPATPATGQGTTPAPGRTPRTELPPPNFDNAPSSTSAPGAGPGD